MTFKSGRLGSSFFRYPIIKSIFKLRSCASSMMMVSYLLKKRSWPNSASKIPSVMSLTIDCADPCSLKRILKLTVLPSCSPNSSAIRFATLRAARRLGWVCPICPVIPRPASIANFGNCVVLPEPVSPATIITWLSIIPWTKSSARWLTGKSRLSFSANFSGILSIRACTACCERVFILSYCARFLVSPSSALLSEPFWSLLLLATAARASSRSKRLR